MTSSTPWKLVTCFVVGSLFVAATSVARDWSVRGNNVTGHFERLKGDKVVLQTSRGQIVAPLADLGPLDQAYITSITKEREWTNESNKRITAAYLGRDATNVIILKDETEFTIPIAKLSAADQAYIEQNHPWHGDASDEAPKSTAKAPKSRAAKPGVAASGTDGNSRPKSRKRDSGSSSFDPPPKSSQLTESSDWRLKNGEVKSGRFVTMQHGAVWLDTGSEVIHIDLQELELKEWSRATELFGEVVTQVARTGGRMPDMPNPRPQDSGPGIPINPALPSGPAGFPSFPESFGGPAGFPANPVPFGGPSGFPGLPGGRPRIPDLPSNFGGPSGIPNSGGSFGGGSGIPNSGGSFGGGSGIPNSSGSFGGGSGMPNSSGSLGGPTGIPENPFPEIPNTFGDHAGIPSSRGSFGGSSGIPENRDSFGGSPTIPGTREFGGRSRPPVATDPMSLVPQPTCESCGKPGYIRPGDRCPHCGAEKHWSHQTKIGEGPTHFESSSGPYSEDRTQRIRIPTRGIAKLVVGVFVLIATGLGALLKAVFGSSSNKEPDHRYQ